MKKYKVYIGQERGTEGWETTVAYFDIELSDEELLVLQKVKSAIERDMHGGKVSIYPLDK